MLQVSYRERICSRFESKPVFLDVLSSVTVPSQHWVKSVHKSGIIRISSLCIKRFPLAFFVGCVPFEHLHVIACEVQPKHWCHLCFCSAHLSQYFPSLMLRRHRAACPLSDQWTERRGETRIQKTETLNCIMAIMWASLSFLPRLLGPAHACSALRS